MHIYFTDYVYEVWNTQPNYCAAYLNNLLRKKFYVLNRQVFGKYRLKEQSFRVIKGLG